LPTVYLNKRVDESPGYVEYDVIDGKQRLESLHLFYGAGPLAGDEDWVRFNSNGSMDEREPKQWRYREDLAPTYQREFRNTLIPVIEVEGTLREIAELFISINSTGKRLTGQERRHAHFGESKTLKVADDLAGDLRKFYLSN